MGYNARYWIDKVERAKVAKDHTKKMQEKYGKQIKECVENTVLYDDSNTPLHEYSQSPNITIADLDTVSGLFKYHEGKTAVLNFASYKNPGGMFIDGSKAQEECLCHESFLCNVLREKNSYYDWNKKYLNKALYLNRALYSKNVIFEHEGSVLEADVITCASPNRSTYLRYNNKPEDNEHNTKVLEERIMFVKRIAELNNLDTIVLGAYGCGVFGQDAKTVAELFKKAFEKTNVKNIIYAVPKGMDSKNFEAFEQVFKN